MIRCKVSPLFVRHRLCMYMYNMCIELEDDIFNVIQLFARDKTLRIFDIRSVLSEV